jgi:DNA-binding CsgD family transcriptional regulator
MREEQRNKNHQRNGNFTRKSFDSMTESSTSSFRPLGSIWIDGDPESMVNVGLKGILEDRANISIENDSRNDTSSSEPSGRPSIVILSLREEEAVSQGVARAQRVRAIEVAADGEIVAPRMLLEYLLANEEPADLNLLSARQREILDMVVEGASNAEIAKRLFLSESTIKQHLRAAYKTLGVHNRTEAANLVRHAG